MHFFLLPPASTRQGLACTSSAGRWLQDLNMTVLIFLHKASAKGFCVTARDGTSWQQKSSTVTSILHRGSCQPVGRVQVEMTSARIALESQDLSVSRAETTTDMNLFFEGIKRNNHMSIKLLPETEKNVPYDKLGLPMSCFTDRFTQHRSCAQVI